MKWKWKCETTKRRKNWSAVDCYEEIQYTWERWWKMHKTHRSRPLELREKITAKFRMNMKVAFSSLLFISNRTTTINRKWKARRRNSITQHSTSYLNSLKSALTAVFETIILNIAVAHFIVVYFQSKLQIIWMWTFSTIKFSRRFIFQQKIMQSQVHTYITTSRPKRW